MPGAERERAAARPRPMRLLWQGRARASRVARRRGGQHRHRHRTQRRGQDHAARRDHGHAARPRLRVVRRARDRSPAGPAAARVRRDRNAVRTLDEVYARFPRLRERREQEAGTLSGGERQMLALGRALMAKPRLLMLDEPSLGLAPLIVREIFAIVSELKAAGVSILLIEQNARAALQVSDYGYVLETGECVVHGPSRDLPANPRVPATYLGAAAAQV